MRLFETHPPEFAGRERIDKDASRGLHVNGPACLEFSKAAAYIFQNIVRRALRLYAPRGLNTASEPLVYHKFYTVFSVFFQISDNLAARRTYP